MAHQWNKETSSLFPMVIDPGAQGAAGPIYFNYRFNRSVAGVWSTKSLSFYADQKHAGRELHSSKGQDVNQLAGDFIIDANGKVALPYYSKDNVDRPTVQALLDECKRLASDPATRPTILAPLYSAPAPAPTSSSAATAATNMLRDLASPFPAQRKVGGAGSGVGDATAAVSAGSATASTAEPSSPVQSLWNTTTALIASTDTATLVTIAAATAGTAYAAWRWYSRRNKRRGAV
jgi:hypothetical protein